MMQVSVLMQLPLKMHSASLRFIAEKWKSQAKSPVSLPQWLKPLLSATCCQAEAVPLLQGKALILDFERLPRIKSFRSL
jgi:hypothetical protein